ncbi:IS30 family transposase [Candidatus Methylospira mobilis]|uniref:IS30 family transposase n=1 Tax=Candidatus Methylospira mobilis TaxID=1808979 RepID=A0A5Q0BFD1_9GAMM|nr:IS30 family transposase [Candidatus Methylospira mobilis]QFY41544.1 IS30 family transposase [Candidatus Methylospira mobilis]QFY41807.1 IS30 family transposase [Candidatus Methylospira mobilis]QFY42113.1 IS30 family transposase [Candidatus Methylospira mobilis]QFY42229.1 IS30 family transposase [Candidatus Methylospira mobilis]QFY43030.1 IS30 family transposase [Candidatus Methylospira mobilis]
MEKKYNHLSAEDRAAIMLMKSDGHSLRAMALRLQRSPSTISRELLRNPVKSGSYCAGTAGIRARQLRHMARKPRKLLPDSLLFGVVDYFLHEGWSPEQISGTLKRVYAEQGALTVSHETIYTALYAFPRGELRSELLSCLRQSHTGRRPRARGTDRRGQIPDMNSLHVRPPEIEDRLVPGHWEGDLIKGSGNRSSVGTLVERSSRLVMLAAMTSGTAEAALEGFSNALNRVHEPMRKTMTYDQGKEMSCHKTLSERAGITIYFADPHSPWQRGSNENTNGLLRQYLPKGTDLSTYSQEQLDEIAYRLNTRPRKILGFRTPLEVYAEFLHNCQKDEAMCESTTVALGI